MDNTQIGALLTRLRQERALTQNQVAERLHVSPQAVSKWECGQGCPDISLLPLLAEVFGVSILRLLAGDLAPEKQEAGNLRRLKFLMCPDCGNILTATGGGEVHCCGRRLEPLSARPGDDAHAITVEEVEEDWYITFSHPMTKEHFIRFAAWTGDDRLLLVRLYPEQDGALRIPHLRGGGVLYLGCNRDGLFSYRLD